MHFLIDVGNMLIGRGRCNVQLPGNLCRSDSVTDQRGDLDLPPGQSGGVPVDLPGVLYIELTGIKVPVQIVKLRQSQTQGYDLFRRKIRQRTSVQHEHGADASVCVEQIEAEGVFQSYGPNIIPGKFESRGTAPVDQPKNRFGGSPPLFFRSA